MLLADCKSVTLWVEWFNSILPHQLVEMLEAEPIPIHWTQRQSPQYEYYYETIKEEAGDNLI